jgi:type IV secretion system protein VirB10
MSVHPEEGRDEDAEPVRSERQIAEALRLRPDRPPVMRLSRKALTVLGGVSALALGGALIWALHTSHGKPAAKELYSTDHNPTADGLARLPGDYRGVAGAAPSGASLVPQLGPPLPGDLGRPILKAGVASPAIGGTAEPSAVTQQRDQARQRVVQEQQAAQTSRLFLGDSVKAAETSASPSAASTGELGGVAGLGALGANPAAAGQTASPSADADHKLAFLNGAADHRTVSTDRIEAPASPYVVQAGAVIAAALVTGLRSDLPGQVTAQVTENVYDGPTGRFLLIPQGARLIGQYDAQIAFGQNRALLVWNRLILPNGRSIVLERQPGADPQGFAGLEDQVDNHWGQLFKAAMLSTVLSVGAEAGTSSNENDLVQALRQGASDSISQAGRQVVGRSLTIQPTITIRPGFPVRVIVTRDLVLEPYGG